MTLVSPAFAFTLDTSDGLRAVRWENRLSGRTLDLGCGPEVEFDLGLPEQPLVTPQLRVNGLPSAVQVAAGEAVFVLESAEPHAAGQCLIMQQWRRAVGLPNTTR